MSSTTSETKSIGDYLIEYELGRGAFGTVYRAHHRDHPETPVALKIVQGRGNTDRMLLEPAMLSRVNHPNVVGLEDYFLRDNDLVLALEFVNGRDLRSMLEDGVRFSQDDVRDLLVQVGSALAAAHEQNVLHRDIKPANVLVVQQPHGYRFVLTDFGIGQVREGIQERKQTGGTFLFMAPEQLRGRPSPQSDLWALGVVAYRLLAGRMPFPGPTIQELTNQILYGAVPSISAVAKQPIDPELERSVLGLLDKSLSERTSSAQELLKQLGKSVTSSARKPTARHNYASVTLDQQLASQIRLKRLLLLLYVLLYLLPGALLSGGLLLAGLTTFYLSQRRGQWLRLGSIGLTLLSFLLLAGFFHYKYVRPQSDVNLITAFNKVQIPGLQNTTFQIIRTGAGSILIIVISYLLPVIAGTTFAMLRRLEREKLLRDLATEEGIGSDRYLQALEQAIDSRFEDVGLHLKFAEALFARGRIKECAVECRLLLKQDPYNFNGNLLLANAYLSLGLFDECIEQCKNYLDVSGYCFEFAELRELAQRRRPV